MTREYLAHPFSEIFPLHEDSIVNLSDNIKLHGQKEEIVLHDGKILDGRRRYAACIRAGVKVKFRKFGSRTADGNDPLEFIFQVHIRRDLTAPERAVAAQKYANLKKGYNPPVGGLGEKPVSQQEAADKFDTSVKQIERVNKVMECGVEELQQAMKSEKVSISDAAAIAGELPDIQREAVRRVLATPKEASTLQAAVESMKPPEPETPLQISQDIEPIRIRLARVETANIEARDLACRGLQTAQVLIAKL